MKRTYVPPSGNFNAKLAGVGEQPGIQEIQYRPPKPFVGPAGKQLDELLIMTKIPRQEVYLTNVIKDLDAPLRHYINIDKYGRSTISKEGYQYIHELGEELSKLNLNVVVAFGNVPLLALCNRLGITKWRGSVLESTLVPGLKVVPTFHPATLIPHAGGQPNYLNKPLIIEDLMRAKYESEFPEIRRAGRNITIKPSFEQSRSALEYCCEIGTRGKTIDLDIEVINGEVDCIAFSWSPTEAISIPFRDKNGDYFTVDQELEIMKWVAKIIQSEQIAKRGAYFIFDTQFLFHKYGIIPRGNLHCTQIAQKIAFPDFPAGLDFVTTMHTDIPYYKQDGKQWMKMGAGTWEQWWNYNGMDSIATSAAHPRQIEVLEKQDNITTYNRQRKLIEPLIYMSERGIKVDVAGMVTFKDKEEKQLEQLNEQLKSIVGFDINPNSPQQLMNYFYKLCGIKPYKKKNAQGQYVDTSDVTALKRIARRGIEGSDAARIMLDIRSLSKRISTYLNIGKVDEDGRYRSSYNPVGAETGRLSSGQTIFKTGGNQQNIPHDILRFFLFDEGYIGYSIDLSQIENRIVAYVGGVISQIEAFETGIDLHRLTASIIFNKPYDQISAEDGSSDLGDGRQSERYWGKKGNHAINYDVSYKKFGLINELSETDSKQVLASVHRGYPQIKGGYHAVIQEMLRKDRTVTNLFGRHRLFLGPVFPQPPYISSYACEETFRQSYAHLPQSTTADKINEQGVEYVYYNQDLFSSIELLAQIHDSIVFQVPLTTSWIKQAEMILLIKKSLEAPLSWHGTKFSTPCDLSMGLNMYKEVMIEYKSKSIPNDIELLAKKLEEGYVKLLNK